MVLKSNSINTTDENIKNKLNLVQKNEINKYKNENNKEVRKKKTLQNEALSLLLPSNHVFDKFYNL